MGGCLALQELHFKLLLLVQQLLLLSSLAVGVRTASRHEKLTFSHYHKFQANKTVGQRGDASFKQIWCTTRFLPWDKFACALLPGCM
jgi:hypothetical protein